MKNLNLLISFIHYCFIGQGRHMRFWQALAGWSGRYIYQSRKLYDYQGLIDTFYSNERRA